MEGIKSLNLFKQIENNQGRKAPGMDLPVHGNDHHEIRNKSAHPHLENSHKEKTDHEQGQLAEFRDMIMTAHESGELNPELLAAQAPDSAIEFAARHNIELTTLVERIAAGHPRIQIRDFRDSILESKANGSFDPEALAQAAPQVLKDYAGKHNIELSQMIEQIAENKSDNLKHIPGMGPGMFIKPGKGMMLAGYAQMERRMDHFLQRVFHEDNA